MKFTLSWLKDHLETDASVEELSVALSEIGLEVDGLEDPAAKLAPFVIAKIVEAGQHPDADRLRVCQVDTGSGMSEVVCGAPNALPGLVGIFAPLGSYIPGTGITLEKKPVRGVVSNGMMVSERELEISDEHDGIIDLGKAYEKHIGESYAEVMRLNDPVFDVDLTPNRPDCTGVRGIARDLAAAGLGKLKPEPKLGKVEGTKAGPVDIKLDFAKDVVNACPMFAGRYVAGVKNGSSPDWMQARLRAIGLRPINALVDITNYISMDRGRPLHVYDADKLQGPIRARMGKPWKDGKPVEGFLGLDDKHYDADDEMCVIADDKVVLGLGGVMGGKDTGCTRETKNVLIECALFDPIRTAITGRRTGLVTDARYRFERGVDPDYVLPGLDLATHMVMEFAGGSPSKRKVAGKQPAAYPVIEFDPARVEKLTGLKLKDTEIKTILKALGFTIAPAGAAIGKGITKDADKSKDAGRLGTSALLSVTVPGWRPDVHGAADLVEEVVRIARLDRVPSTPLPRASGVTGAVLTLRQRRARRARRVLAGRGLVEAITWSFIPQGHAEHFGGGGDGMTLANPISIEMSTMRPTLLAGLLTAMQRNRNHGEPDCAFFELGQAYRGVQPEDQFLAASGVRSGTAKVGGAGRHWSGAAGLVDLMDVKADVADLLGALGLDANKAQVTRDAPGWYHPGRSGVFRLGPKNILAHFGEVHPATLKELDVDGPVVAFEVFLEALPAERKKKSRTRPGLDATGLLPVRRDFAFALDAAVPASDVVRAAKSADKKLIAGVNVFDLFEGGALTEAGQKSLGVEVTLQPLRKTLTDEEIETVSAKVIASVKKATGGEVRG